MNDKFLEGCEKLSDGRYRIREKITVLPIKCKEPINEKIIVEGKEVSPKRKYTFLIWNDEFNGNGRNYKYVIPRVIKENRPTFTLADHPLDGQEADSLRICGCGKNYRKLDGWLATDWYPLGELGNRIADGFDLGVPSLVSSSVLGGLDNEGYVMDDDSFFLERICDILIDFPSNGVFHYSDHVDSMDDNYHFTKISEEGLNEGITILNKSDKFFKIKENKGDVIMADNVNNDELIQQSMILNIKSMLKDADKITDVFDKKEALVSADAFAQKLTDDKLHIEICKKIEDVDSEIKNLSTKGLQTDNLAEKVKSLEDENGELKTELESIKKKFKTLADMYDEEQYNASEAELETTAKFEKMNKRLVLENKALRERNLKMRKQISQNNNVFESKMKKLEADSNTKVDAEVVIEYKKRIKSLEDEIEDLKNKLKKTTFDLKRTSFNLKKTTGNLNDTTDELESVKKVNDAVDVEIGAEEVIALKEKLNELIMKNNDLAMKNGRLRKALNDSRREEKQSRFSKIRKRFENEDDSSSEVVDKEMIDSEINDDEVVVTDNGISIERDEDEIMEKMLNGQIK